MRILGFFGNIKIHTKVIIFVLPFLFCIFLLGIVSIYSSLRFQSRIQMTSGVVTSLSGFKELSASVDRFLTHSEQATFEDVNNRIGKQKETLALTRRELPLDDASVPSLDIAIAGATAVTDKVESLWQLHQQEEALRKTINNALQILMGAEITMGDRIEQAQKAARRSQQKVTELSSAIEQLRPQVAALEIMVKTLREAAGAPYDLGPETDAISAKVAALEAALDARKIAHAPAKLHLTASALADPPQLDALSGYVADRKVLVETRFTALERMLKDGANRREQADVLISSGRGVSNSIYYIQIVAASFLENPSVAALKRLNGKIDAARRSLDALRNNGKLIPGVIQQAQVTLALSQLEQASVSLVTLVERRVQDRDDVVAEIDHSWQALQQFAELQKNAAQRESTNANSNSLVGAVLGAVAALVSGLMLVWALKGPITRITSSMRRLADGDLESVIVGDTRADELGEMARALQVFKKNAQAKICFEADAAEQQRLSDIERGRNDAEKRMLDEKIAEAVAELGLGLGRLARGDLSTLIEQPFIEQLEQLRTDFNESLARLNETMFEIRGTAGAIQENSGSMRGSAHALARRTEAQTAELEEVAAAVEQIAAKADSSTNRTEQANAAVYETRERARRAVMVVERTMDAVERIEKASSEIEKITEVIDDIAFQTNLLALNAGIEAARAGETGKGFAVVAQEVRELAQHSATAAHKIKELIDRSGEEVRKGSRLTADTKDVLVSINEHVTNVSRFMDDIAISSRDQSSAIIEVNASISMLDTMTQQNQAMVDQTTNQSSVLAAKADSLMVLVHQFRLGNAGRLQSFDDDDLQRRQAS